MAMRTSLRKKVHETLTLRKKAAMQPEKKVERFVFADIYSYLCTTKKYQNL